MDSIKENVVELANDLRSFIDQVPTSYHAGQSIMERLIDKGFIRLSELDTWQLESGKGYFISHDNSAVVAFRIGNKPVVDTGFNVVGAHTDSPSLKLKVKSERLTNGCARVGVEVYGGAIINTWLDRNLGIAGRVIVKGEKGYSSKLVAIDEPVAIIPNLAIHLNRDVNKGIEINKQTQLSALFGPCDEGDHDIIKKLVATELDVDIANVGGMELYLYDINSSALCGIDRSLISSARIDNLAMCHAITTALCNSEPGDSTVVGVFFDHEEIGSQTSQGADSNLLRNLLERIVAVQGGCREDYFRAIARSFMISADGAHAVHPNYSDKHDPAYAPEINKGPVIKMSANMRYTTTAESANRFIELCNAINVPYQEIINRSDIPSGSTIGPVCSSTLGIKSIDVGNPMWAMHSIRETAGIYDHYYMTEILRFFYSI